MLFAKLQESLRKQGLKLFLYYPPHLFR